MNESMTRDADSVQQRVMAAPTTSIADAVAEARRLRRTATATIVAAAAQLRGIGVHAPAT